jgi:hypothetical protein
MKKINSISTLFAAIAIVFFLSNCDKTKDIDCLVPTNGAISKITNNSAEANWTAQADAGQYLFQYRVAGTTGTFKALRIASGTTTAIVDLLPGTTYEYQFQSNCSGSNSALSTIATFTTLSDNDVNILHKWRVNFWKEDSVQNAVINSDFIEFLSGGTLNQLLPGASNSGTWSFVSNQDSIKIVAGASNKTWFIKTLTSSSLLLTKASNQTSTTDSLEMVPF